MPENLNKWQQLNDWRQNLRMIIRIEKSRIFINELQVSTIYLCKNMSLTTIIYFLCKLFNIYGVESVDK